MQELLKIIIIYIFFIFKKKSDLNDKMNEKQTKVFLGRDQHIEAALVF